MKERTTYRAAMIPKRASVLKVGAFYLVVGLSVAFASETLVLDFESPTTGLKAAGIVFENIFGVAPGHVSAMVEGLVTSPSGTNAVATGGARIKFSIPVVRVAMLVSPFILYGPARTNIYYTARLKAYGKDGKVLGTSEAQMFYIVAEPELFQNFTPTPISIGAAEPIAQVTVDVDEPFREDGATFYFDDLTLTIQQQQPLAQPTLKIQRLGDRIRVSGSISSAEFEQTPELVNPSWQPLNVPPGLLWNWAPLMEPCFSTR